MGARESRRRDAAMTSGPAETTGAEPAQLFYQTSVRFDAAQAALIQAHSERTGWSRMETIRWLVAFGSERAAEIPLKPRGGSLPRRPRRRRAAQGVGRPPVSDERRRASAA